MPKVTYIAEGGASWTLDVPLGVSVMQAALHAGIEGIVAECGGSCMCATCHIYADETRLTDLPPMGPTEDAMLDSTASERRVNSRLSCQLLVRAEMEGLIVRIPAVQT